MKVFRTLLALMLMLFMYDAAFGATLKWNAPVSGADGYKVYYNGSSKLTSNTSIDIVELNLVPGVLYTMTVTAYSSTGESGKSNVVEYTLPVFTPDENPLPVVIVIPGKVTITIE